VQVYWLRQFWFGEKFYDDTSLHKHYHTIAFAHQPNIDAQIWLTIFSSGATFEDGAVTNLGIAAAGIKSFRFVNDRGETELTTLDAWSSHIRVERCVELTVAFHVKLAWAKAEGNIYYWE
jgi:hypothetical protein